MNFLCLFLLALLAVAALGSWIVFGLVVLTAHTFSSACWSVFWFAAMWFFVSAYAHLATVWGVR